MKRPSFTVLALALVWNSRFGPGPAYAHEVEYYDLASLYWLSDLAVEAIEPDYQTGPLFLKGEVRVLQCFKGGLREGETATVSLKPCEEYPPSDPAPGMATGVAAGAATPGKAAAVPSRVVMFLLNSGDGKTYQPLSNGVKYLTGTRILSYRLNHIPQPPQRVLQTAEFVDVEEGQAYSEKAFREDLRRAVERARAFSAPHQAKDCPGLIPFLKNERIASQGKTDELSCETARILAEQADPEFVFESCREPAGLCLKALSILRNGFGNPDRFDFLWRVTSDSRASEKSEALAFELLALNRQAGYFTGSPTPERERLQTQFRDQVLRQASFRLSSSNSPVRVLGAAGVIFAWHPARKGSTPSAPLDDPAMENLRNAIEAQGNPYCQFKLLKYYCGLGQAPAYRSFFHDALDLVGGPPEGLHAETIEVFALDPERWKAIERPPILMAESLDPASRDRIYSAVSDDATDEKWRKLRDSAAECLERLPYASRFDEPLPPGAYRLRVRGEYIFNGQKKVWSSLPSQPVQK
ncbi:MAG: hypothetical protein HYU36_15230 [Planctomycetes bacterium]|nr:hypothetical protein [Planctomycetota bacterium]